MAVMCPPSGVGAGFPKLVNRADICAISGACAFSIFAARVRTSWFCDRPGTNWAISTAWAWCGYIIWRNVTSASLKSVRVAADGDAELPWSIPGMDPVMLGEVDVPDGLDEVEGLLPHPAASRATAAAAATTALKCIVEVNMVVLLANCEYTDGGQKKPCGLHARPPVNACQIRRIDNSGRDNTVQGGAR